MTKKFRAFTAGNRIPLDMGTLHFVGIGGIGMSGIAEILKNLGYAVQGSDIGDSANVQRLRKLGVAVAIGHAAANLGKAKVVVVSSAIHPDNPELLAARKKLGSQVVTTGTIPNAVATSPTCPTSSASRRSR